MVDRSLTADKRVSLIKIVLSDRNETDVIKCLQRDDAQSFIDVVDEVLYSFIPGE